GTGFPHHRDVGQASPPPKLHAPDSAIPRDPIPTMRQTLGGIMPALSPAAQSPPNQDPGPVDNSRRYLIPGLGCTTASTTYKNLKIRFRRRAHVQLRVRQEAASSARRRDPRPTTGLADAPGWSLPAGIPGVARANR